MISIIVPVYNVEAYLRRCVDSILGQKHAEFELILIDDGSTDNSGLICDAYLADSRVSVIHKENGGVSAARNTGIEAAKGEYLYFADPDDWLAEDALSKMLAGGNGADLILCGAYEARQCEDGQYKITKQIHWTGKNQPFPVKDKYREIFDISVQLWNKMIRRSVIAESRFNTNMHYGEDAEFLCRILDHVHTAVIVPEELYFYFINRPGNVVSARLDERSVEYLDNVRGMYDYLAVRGHAASGVKRIYLAVRSVLSKVPLTADGVRESSAYAAYARKTLRYPRFMHRIQFYFTPGIAWYMKILYLLMLYNPWHMYFRLLAKKAVQGIPGK